MSVADLVESVYFVGAVDPYSAEFNRKAIQLAQWMVANAERPSSAFEMAGAMYNATRKDEADERED